MADSRFDSLRTIAKRACCGALPHPMSIENWYRVRPVPHLESIAWVGGAASSIGVWQWWRVFDERMLYHLRLK